MFLITVIKKHLVTNMLIKYTLEYFYGIFKFSNNKLKSAENFETPQKSK